MTMLLFGATGDLAARKLFPALFRMFLDQKLPEPFWIVAIGRRAWSQSRFRSRVEKSLLDFCQDRSADFSRLPAFLQRVEYYEMDVRQPQAYLNLHQYVRSGEGERLIGDNRLFYLSVSPDLFAGIAGNLQSSGLSQTNGWRRLMIEKPFGSDLASARDLNRKLGEVFAEEEIYRIDHYLGKPMVQSLGTLKSVNPIIHAVWNSPYIANVQITASETIGVEERSAYYDQTGAIRDMLQNHLLQLAIMTAMHVPGRMTAEEVRAEKRSVIEAMRPLGQEDVRLHVVRGQYSNGSIDGTPVCAYRDEAGVAPRSMTDTFVAARLFIDLPRWQGVPFYLRTGKRMNEKSTRIVVQCKSSEEAELPNLVVIHVSPNQGMTLRLNLHAPGMPGQLEPVEMAYVPNQKHLPESYEMLLAEAMRGDRTHFAHWEEVELAWRWVEPILAAFAENRVPLHHYPAGTNGPDAANRLLEEDGFTWWLDPEDEPLLTPVHAR
ncbi:glucose-6-phosphate dehydrogenase [Brevibacillus panacihumi]